MNKERERERGGGGRERETRSICAHSLRSNKTNQFIYLCANGVKINWYYLVLFNLCNFVFCAQRRVAALEENGKWRTSAMIHWYTRASRAAHITIQSQFILKCSKHSLHFHISASRARAIWQQQSISAVDTFARPNACEKNIRSEILLTTIFISAFVCMCVSVCYHRCLLYPRSEYKRRENEKTALFSRCFAEYLINTVGIVRLYSGSMRFGWRVFLFLLFFSVKILYFRSLCASKSAPSFHSPPVHSTHNWDWGDDKAKVRIQIKSICYGIFLLTSVVPFDVCVMLNASILSCVLCTVWLRGCVCAVCIAFIADNVM